MTKPPAILNELLDNPPPQDTPPARLQESDLAQFTGAQQWFRHPIARNVLYTEGAQFMAEKGGAYWLLDELAFAQHKPRVAAEEFQHWRLAVNLAEQTATLTCDDGNGRVVFSKAIPYTDFPLPEQRLYFTDGTILLPTEY